MASTYSDQFWVMDPGNPPAPGTALDVETFEFTDRSDDGVISRAGRDKFEGDKITHVWNGDTVTVEIAGQGQVTVTGVTFYVQGGAKVFTPTDGTVLQDAVFVSSTYVTKSTHLDLEDLAPACFTPGTRIETALGPVPVELIRVGDLVRTADDGFLPVVWTGRRQVAAQGRFAPVRIAPGVLGNSRTLTVSPQHRVLMSGWAAELCSSEAEALVPACRLVDGHRVRVVSGGSVDYIHLGFDRHALVLSEGAWTESHFASIGARAEGRALFPAAPVGERAPRVVRPVLRGHESRAVVASMLC